MNKVSDKLVPKELAPFLPLASAFIPGLGLGGIFQGLGASPAIAEMLARYSAGQLATGLSSAKMTGEVDPKLQALAGVQSYLQGPIKQTAAETALLEDKELMKQLQRSDALQNSTSITDINDLKKLQGEVEGLNFMQDGGGGTGGFKERFYDYINPSQPGDTIFGFDSPFAPDEVLSFNTGDGMRYFKPGSADLNTFLESGGGGTAPDFSKLTGDALKEKLVGGTSLTDKTFDTRLSKLQDTLGKERGLTATNKARDFFQDDFGFNKATMAKVGMAATPYIKNEMDIAAKKIEEENAAAEAANQSYRDASSALSNYFVNRDPNYGMLYGYNQGGLAGIRTAYNMGGMGSIPQTPMVPQGMQLEGRGGGFIPMGAQEKKDDVPAMLAKNEFVMTSDAVRAAGGGSIEKGAQKMYDLMNSLEAQV